MEAAILEPEFDNDYSYLIYPIDHPCPQARPCLDKLKPLFAHKLRMIRVMAARAKVPCNLNVAYLQQLWETQEGRCYYTGTPLVMANHHGKGNTGFKLHAQPWNWSLSCVEPKAGYVPDQVAWTGALINAMKVGQSESAFQAMCALVTASSSKRMDLHLTPAPPMRKRRKSRTSAPVVEPPGNVVVLAQA